MIRCLGEGLQIMVHQIMQVDSRLKSRGMRVKDQVIML